MTKPETLARAFAILRGVMLVLFCVFLIVAPEKALPGSSTEPARSVALMFASRTILLGTLLVVLAVRLKREGLAWLLLADAALQIFDVAMALAEHKGAVALLPAALCAFDGWAGLCLLGAAAKARTYFPRRSDA